MEMILYFISNNPLTFIINDMLLGHLLEHARTAEFIIWANDPLCNRMQISRLSRWFVLPTQLENV